MENLSLTIESKNRLNLKTGSRIYYCFYGAILLIIGSRIILNETYTLYGIVAIVFGLLSLVYGIIGKELLLTHNYLRMDPENLRIKRSADRAANIKLSEITHLKFTHYGFDVTFDDFVKSYDLSWLSLDEFQILKTKLQQYGNKNNVTVD